MTSTLHLAAQYLATAAISFITKKEDDSHTNLGWKNHSLETHKFPNGDKLGLSYESFSLEWIHSNGNKEHFLLNKTTHKDIINWIIQTSKNNGIEMPYQYELHYELPYNQVSDGTSFEITNSENLHVLIQQRDLAQKVISTILKSNDFESPIRIWPHHFDTGAFVNISDQLSIGLGMAMPDTLIDSFYFYVSGYNGHQPIDIALTNSTNKGSYYSNGWQGFAMSINELDEHSAIEFCQVAINTYENTIK
ncbi:hypothetical protein [uncultured Psychroserpens sp.]|uniref:hypothetical protein n=1 Tax=uncultured Psychroserpens sp. TaxID=255436 RepID=UPI002615C916|nr:hypothetical protein [uncultured Psychroserpens sp.]